MGIEKDKLIESEQYYALAKEILLNINAIKYCLCGKTFHVVNHEPYALAIYILKKDHAQATNIALFKQSIRQILSEDYMETTCPNCES